VLSSLAPHIYATTPDSPEGYRLGVGACGDDTLRGLPAKGNARYNRLVRSAATIRVKVLFFGRLKEILGRSEDSVDLAEGTPIESLFGRYAASHPGLAGFRASLVTSRNQEFAAWSTPLAANDEVAFLPPVSGG